MAKRYVHHVVVGSGRFESLAYLQRLEDGGFVRYYLSTDKAGKLAFTGYVRCAVEPVLEFLALKRLQKKLGRRISPAVLYSLDGDFDGSLDPS